MRILHVVGRMDRAGLETFIMNIYRNINREKIQFDFIVHTEDKAAYDDEIEELGGKIYHVVRYNPPNLKYFEQVNSIMSANTYEIVHSHIDCMSSLPLAIAKYNKIPIRIAHSHSSSESFDIKYPIKFLSKLLIPVFATNLFACGVRAGKWMFGRKKFSVIKNGIDTVKFKFDNDVRNNVREKLGIEQGQVVIGHVGRFEVVKNHEFILKIFSSYHLINKNSVLILVGKGELEDKIKSLASDLGIKNCIKFLGVRDDIPQLMNAMDLFLMPSFFEGLPLVLVESQSTGLPCLISNIIPHDCDIVPTLITRESLENSADIWANNIDIMLNKCRRTNCSNVVKDKGFDSVTNANMMENIYFDLVREAR